ncbi:TlpA family protein disulfide reductase [Alkalicoccobacillus porphyridii]|nr:TlpA disulfide reductase family protein [Alkalicoccobacillus porphyridii]
MKKKVSMLIFVAAITLSVFLIVMNVINGSEPETGIEKGMKAESLTLDRYQGEAADVLPDDNQVTIMNIWATWCEPCVRELPDLLELDNDYRDSGLAVITVNAQKYERVVEHTEEFIQEQNLTLPVFLDSEAELFQLYQIRGMPTTLVIDHEGIIVERIEGEVNYEMLEAIVIPLLNE